ncbi:MAG: hypothetical protein CMA53_01400 [Euryarchaeota archaeon]|nr:hypothetical protein [Euryarchaeota archaeon]|tara:strand:- start:950 stop:1186 length:237 start_codon:yes stop_codon:yes gene_type:complete
MEKKMTTENEKPQIDITPSDLMIIRQVFDAATQAGIFKASDLTAVGGVFDKVNAIVEGMIAAAKADEENNNTEQPKEE